MSFTKFTANLISCLPASRRKGSVYTQLTLHDPVHPASNSLLQRIPNYIKIPNDEISILLNIGKLLMLPLRGVTKSMIEKVILNAGCGRTAELEKSEKAHPDIKYVYLDIRDNVGADVVHDLNALPLPFADNYFDEIILSHIIEHLNDAYLFLEEVHRILKPNGIVRIVTPHYTDWTYWRDPGHKLHFNSYSFDRFEDTRGHHFDTKYPFKIEELRVDLQNLWRYLGLEFLINLSIKANPLRSIRKFWEAYLCFIIRGVTIKVKMRALK